MCQTYGIQAMLKRNDFSYIKLVPRHQHHQDVKVCSIIAAKCKLDLKLFGIDLIPASEHYGGIDRLYSTHSVLVNHPLHRPYQYSNQILTTITVCETINGVNNDIIINSLLRYITMVQYILTMVLLEQ